MFAFLRRAITNTTPAGQHDANALPPHVLDVVRVEIENRIGLLRVELHAFFGSLHADEVARLNGVQARLESDLMVLLRFRRTPDSELESELTESMRAVIDEATAQIRQALLDRADLNMRVLEQELVRVTSRLDSRLTALSSRCAGSAEGNDASRVPFSPEA